MKGKFRDTSFVAVSNIINNLLLTIYILIYNKLFIVHYGSSITGLISSLTQFVTMFTMIEGGFTLAAVVASYKPILSEDYKELNSILFTSKVFLARITKYFILVTICGGGIYLYYLNASVSYSVSFILLVFTIFTSAITIGGISKYSIVFAGNNKQYIIVLISVFCKTITWVISLVLIYYNKSIIAVYSLNLINALLNLFTLKYYERKRYPYVTYRGEYDLKIIKGSNDLLFQKIASTVFNSTDLVLVSIGLSLSKASVYYIYNQIFQGVYLYLSSFGNAPSDSFGHLLKTQEKNKVSKAYLIYKKSLCVISTIILSETSAMIIPFLRVYTRNIHDEKYIIPSLSLVFYSYFFMKINNLPYGLIINASGEFKKQNIQTALSVIANIFISILFMKIWGLNGIVFGSAIGVLIILSFNIFRANEIIAIDILGDIISLVLNFLIGLLISVYGCYSNEVIENNYISWGICSIFLLIVISIVVLLLNYILDKATIKECFEYYKSRFIK